MSRQLRMLDDPSGLVEITSRTQHGRFLMCPSEKVNDLILGVLGRAQAMYGVALHAFCFMSNHNHILGYRELRRTDVPLHRVSQRKPRQRNWTPSRLERDLLGTALPFRVRQRNGARPSQAISLHPRQRLQRRTRRLTARVARCLQRTRALPWRNNDARALGTTVPRSIGPACAAEKQALPFYRDRPFDPASVPPRTKRRRTTSVLRRSGPGDRAQNRSNAPRKWHDSYGGSSHSTPETSRQTEGVQSLPPRRLSTPRTGRTFGRCTTRARPRLPPIATLPNV